MNQIICDYCHDKIEKTNTLEHLKCCKFFNQFIEKVAAYECTLCYVKMFQDIEMFCHLKQVHNDVILERSKIIHDLISNKPADCNYRLKIVTEVQETNELEIHNQSFEGSEIDGKENLVLLPNDEGLIDDDFKTKSEVHEEKEFVVNSVNESFKEIKNNSKENIVNDQIGKENIDNIFCKFLSEVEDAEELEITVKNKSFEHREKDEKEIVTLNVGDISKTKINESLEFSNSDDFIKNITDEEEELANYFCNRGNTVLCQGGLQTRKPGNKTRASPQFVKIDDDIETETAEGQENLSLIAVTKDVNKENQTPIVQEKGSFGSVSERKKLTNKIKLESLTRRKLRSSNESGTNLSLIDDDDLQNKKSKRNYITESYQQSYPRKDMDTECQICLRKFTRNFDMRRHMKLVHKKIVVKKRKEYSKKCPFCSKKFTRHSGMKKHMKLVHKEENIEHHHEIAKPTNPGFFECNTCLTKFSRNVDLKKHIEVFHEMEIMSFKCDCCFFEVDSEDKLKKHISEAHEGKKPPTEDFQISDEKELTSSESDESMDDLN